MKSIIVFLKDVENIAEKYPRLQVRAKAVRWDLEKAMKVAQKKAKEAKPPATDNKQSDAIALVCEVGKLIDDKGDLPLWAYRNQARIRTVCIAQQHT